MKAEELLAHTDFLRKLSKSLVIDPHMADEITHETWLATVKNPPYTNQNLVLGGVVPSRSAGISGHPLGFLCI